MNRIYPSYRVTRAGRVWSDKSKKYLKQADNGTGYIFVRLRNKDVIKNFYVHRLVAIEYLPNPSDFPQVNHIDGDKTNNHVSNLEWCTPRMNHWHSKGDPDYKKMESDYDKMKSKQDRLAEFIKSGVPEEVARYSLSL